MILPIYFETLENCFPFFLGVILRKNSVRCMILGCKLKQTILTELP